MSLARGVLRFARAASLARRCPSVLVDAEAGKNITKILRVRIRLEPDSRCGQRVGRLGSARAPKVTGGVFPSAPALVTIMSKCNLKKTMDHHQVAK